jgi:hypothetical protein
VRGWGHQSKVKLALSQASAHFFHSYPSRARTGKVWWVGWVEHEGLKQGER